VVDGGATFTSTGFEELSASSRIVLGIVAEKNSVWRFFGSRLTMRFSAWMKPRSSIWSASSSTRISSRAGQRALVDQVEQAARRGDDDVDAGCSTRIWRGIGTPPKMVSDAQLEELAVGVEALGNLAGQLTRRRQHQHAAALDRARLGVGDIVSSEGSAKAAVLPVPVCAMPHRSRPSISAGMACAWMGVGVLVALGGERLLERRDEAEVGLIIDALSVRENRPDLVHETTRVKGEPLATAPKGGTIRNAAVVHAARPDALRCIGAMAHMAYCRCESNMRANAEGGPWSQEGLRIDPFVSSRGRACREPVSRRYRDSLAQIPRYAVSTGSTATRDEQNESVMTA
jgi:hypothetical protein